MKSQIFLGFGLLATGVIAGERVSFTERTAGDWTLVGASTIEPGTGSGVSIPAGAQLIRSFATSRLSVSLSADVSSKASGDEIATLEVGPAALALASSGDGVLILVVGDGQPLAVRSQKAGASTSLEITLTYDAVAGTVGIGREGKLDSFDAPKSACPIEVVFTAGKRDALNISRLTFEVGNDAAGSQSNPEAQGNAGVDQSAGSSANGARVPAAETRLGTLTDPISVAARVKTPDPSGGPPRQELEIYTPPSIHRGRAAAVRAAAKPEGRVTP